MVTKPQRALRRGRHLPDASHPQRDDPHRWRMPPPQRRTMVPADQQRLSPDPAQPAQLRPWLWSREGTSRRCHRRFRASRCAHTSSHPAADVRLQCHCPEFCTNGLEQPLQRRMGKCYLRPDLAYGRPCHQSDRDAPSLRLSLRQCRI